MYNEHIYLDNLLERSGMSYDELLQLEKEYPIVKVLINDIFKEEKKLEELEKRQNAIEEKIRILKKSLA